MADPKIQSACSNRSVRLRHCAYFSRPYQSNDYRIIIPSDVLMSYPRVHAQRHHDNRKSRARPCYRKQLRPSRRIGLKTSKEISKERRHENLDMTSATTTALQKRPGMELEVEVGEDMKNGRGMKDRVRDEIHPPIDRQDPRHGMICRQL